MKLKILTLGGGREVGRAAIAIKRNGDEHYTLFDYGISFDVDDRPVLPLSIAPSKLKAVFISHSHLDHVGAAPFFYISANPLIYMSKFTAITARLMIEDLLRISGYYLPFEFLELDAMMKSVTTFNIGDRFEVGDVSVDTFNAGHIPGSTMYRVEFREGASVLYTGDVNAIDTKIVKGVHSQNLNADVLIMEATYGMYDHPPRERVEQLFIEAVRGVVEEGGIVLVPAFSLGRSQEILALLAEKMPHANVYYDGMARDILELMLLYKEYINRHDLLEKATNIFTQVKDSGMRKGICKEGGSIIVTPAGMLKGGPALYYIKRIYDNPKNAIMLVSYQAASSPGRKLLTEGVLENGGIRVKAKVFWFDFSSHAGASDLVNFVKNVKNLQKVILIHGSEDAIYSLGYRIKEETGVEFVAPQIGEELSIEL
jgi:putative mRNA 3-end processing factor